MAGPQDAWMRAQVQRVLDAARRPDLVEVVGFVDHLPTLYRGATALLVTSGHEGFCLPALEAMACGAPVVAFTNSAIPEVVGDGGTLVADGDVAQLVRATHSLIEDAELRRAQSGRGVQRASQFSWRRSADAHADVYRAAQSTSVR
jgi:glycosyltransferase involved in cell wall biosynthesis